MNENGSDRWFFNRPLIDAAGSVYALTENRLSSVVHPVTGQALKLVRRSLAAGESGPFHRITWINDRVFSMVPDGARDLILVNALTMEFDRPNSKSAENELEKLLKSHWSAARVDGGAIYFSRGFSCLLSWDRAGNRLAGLHDPFADPQTNDAECSLLSDASGVIFASRGYNNDDSDTRVFLWDGANRLITIGGIRSMYCSFSDLGDGWIAAYGSIRKGSYHRKNGIIALAPDWLLFRLPQSHRFCTRPGEDGSGPSPV